MVSDFFHARRECLTYSMVRMSDLFCPTNYVFPKILVPWDSPGVPGACISGGPRSRSMPTSDSGYLGSI